MNLALFSSAPPSDVRKGFCFDEPRSLSSALPAQRAEKYMMTSLLRLCHPMCGKALPFREASLNIFPRLGLTGGTASRDF